VLRYGRDQNEMIKGLDAGTSFSIHDMIEIWENYSNNGRDVDFSGDKNYPYPFKIEMLNRPLILASKTRQDREMWVRGLKVIIESKRAPVYIHTYNNEKRPLESSRRS
jgi:hypothetical protein